MSASWGSISVAGVAANGVGTQLFPTSLPTTVTTAAWPPATAGLVRKPIHGKLENLFVSTDGTNGGTFELWDVAGLDRGASNNVNDQLLLTDAYMVANGRKIWELRIVGNSDQPYDLLMAIDHLEFYNGLACRFLSSSVANAGSVTVVPMAELGFSVYYQHG